MFSSVNLSDSVFLQQKTQNDPKNFMGSTMHASSQRRFHEIFSGRFVLFVVQKEFLRYQLPDALPSSLSYYSEYYRQ